ncbi:MAG: hypothetical protein ACI9YL_001965, partial [Luteibaculaceae bacterium]
MKTPYLIGLLTFLSLSAVAQSESTTSFPDTLDKRRLNTAIGIGVGAYLTGLYFLNNVWYKNHERVPFHYYNDSKGYLQMDKFGHAYGAYRESSLAYYALRKAGMDKRKALIYGGPIG